MLKAKIIISVKERTVIDSVKDFIKKKLGSSLHSYRPSKKLNLNLDKKMTFVSKIKSKVTLKEKFLICAVNGLFYLENNKLYNIFENANFTGIDKCKKKFFVACAGGYATEGCVISFNYTSNKIKNPKIEFKLPEQQLHELKISKNKLYLVNSAWRLNMLDEILEFNIGNNSLKFKKRIEPKTDYPFIHLNSICIKKNSILLLYHNMTEYTKIPSQICEFDNNWKFLKIVEIENLSSAHNINIIDKKISVLNSRYGIFLLGKNKFNFPNKFLSGIDYDKKNYYLGLNSIVPRSQRKKAPSYLGIINKKTKQISSVLLPKTGKITALKVVR